MPKRGAAAIALTGLALALLLNFRTPTAPETTTGGTTTGGSGSSGGSAATSGKTGSSGAGSGTSGASGTSGTSGSTSSSSSGSTAAGTKTVDGPVIDTRYGPVQVEVTVANGQLTAVAALQLPNEDRRSAGISNRAEPMLRSEALAAQSASIDGVSGATYTSDGYAQSLQAALDAAGM
jgi:uncharacterized protein with FMN-binding domain